jgi:hypothetical protein
VCVVLTEAVLPTSVIVDRARWRSPTPCCHDDPSSLGGSVPAGTRGIIQAIDRIRPDDDTYLVEIVASERLTGEQAWLRSIDLLVASDLRDGRVEPGHFSSASPPLALCASRSSPDRQHARYQVHTKGVARAWS